MNEPLGPALGTPSEVRAAIDVLAGRGDSRLRDVSVRLSQQAMVLRGIDATDWIPISKSTYDECIDPRDYRPKPT